MRRVDREQQARERLQVDRTLVDGGHAVLILRRIYAVPTTNAPAALEALHKLETAVPKVGISRDVEERHAQIRTEIQRVRALAMSALDAEMQQRDRAAGGRR